MMIKETTISNGNNEFKNNIFSESDWTAPIMVDPSQIKSTIDTLNLIGRKVTNIRAIGLCYNLMEESIEDAVYNCLNGIDEEERLIRSNWDNIDGSIKFDRVLEIDEPVLIEFEDGNIFEIDVPQVPEFRMGMNLIPWNIEAGTNSPNADACIILEPCLNQMITDIEVNTYKTTEDPMFSKPFDEEPYEREFVSEIVVWFENKMGLCISGFYDYGMAYCINNNYETLQMPFEKLKTALLERQGNAREYKMI